MALIERSELQKKLGQIPNYQDDEHEAYVSLREVRAVIEQLPAVNAEPVIDGVWRYYVNDEGKARWRCYPETKEQLLELCYGPTHSSRYDVTYTIPGRGVFKEAEVVRCKNGPVVNFMEDYMRRRDPDCMRIGDDLPAPDQIHAGII